MVLPPFDIESGESMPAVGATGEDARRTAAGTAALLLLSASDGFSGFFICCSAAFGFAFIPKLLAFGEG
jgi:hypothetical protein